MLHYDNDDDENDDDDDDEDDGSDDDDETKQQQKKTFRQKPRIYSLSMAPTTAVDIRIVYNSFGFCFPCSYTAHCVVPILWMDVLFAMVAI